MYAGVCMIRGLLLKANLCICCVSVIYCNGSRCSLKQRSCLEMEQGYGWAELPNTFLGNTSVASSANGARYTSVKHHVEATVISPVEWY